IALQFVVGMKDAAFQLVRGEAVTLLQFARVPDELLHGPDFSRAVLRIRVAEEEVRGERHALLQTTAENVIDRYAPLLPEKIEAGEFEGGQDLRPVVVERGRRV